MPSTRLLPASTTITRRTPKIKGQEDIKNEITIEKLEPSKDNYYQDLPTAPSLSAEYQNEDTSGIAAH